MAMRWFLHSACHLIGYYPDVDNKINTTSFKQTEHVIGYPNNKKVRDHDQYTDLGDDQVIKTKSSSNGMSKIEIINKKNYPSEFQMPLHYPRYKKSDYEKMEEWKLDLLLLEYGLCFKGTLDEKRSFAMGAFLWPDQY